MKIAAFLFCLLTVQLFSQNWTWDTIVAAQGNIRLSKAKFNHVYTYTRGGNEVRKYFDNGKFIFQINFPQNLRIKSITCSPDSSIYILALFTNTLTITSASVVSRGGDDICVVKLNQAGHLIWLTSAGSKSHDQAGDISMNGINFIFTGAVSDTTYFSGQMIPKVPGKDLFIAKYFANGTLDGALVSYPPPYPAPNRWEGLQIALDQAGQIVVLTAWNDDESLNYYVLKFTQMLQFIWQSNVISSPKSNVDNLTIDSQNNIFFTYILGSQYSPPMTTIKKITPGGSGPINHYSEGRGVLMGLDVDSCNNLYFTGYHERSFYMAYTPVHMVSTGQISPSGNVNWIKLDSSYTYKSGSDVIALGPNRCYVAGYFSDSLYLKNHLVDTNSKRAYFQAILQTTVGIPANTTPLANLTLCEGRSTTLSAQSAGPISWYQSAVGTVPLHSSSSYITPPLSAGIHTLYAEASSCTMTTGRAPITVTVKPNPTILVNGGTICRKQSFIITPAGAVSYSFSGGSALVSPLASSVYTIIGSGVNGCTATALSYVTVLPLPELVVSAGQNFSCIGETVTLICSGAQSYTWNTGSNLSYTVISPVAPVTYTIAGTGSNGCGDTIVHQHAVAPCLDVEENVEEQNIKVYPNPGSGDFICELDSECRIRVLNCLAQVLFEVKGVAGKNHIDLNAYHGGLYIIEINGAHSSRLLKLLKY
jgi:hypothetical protein